MDAWLLHYLADTWYSVFLILDFLVGVSQHHILNAHQGSGFWIVFENSENRKSFRDSVNINYFSSTIGVYSLYRKKKI